MTENNPINGLVEEVLKNNNFIDDEPVLYKSYASQNIINPEESYSLGFISIISFTSHPFVFFVLENGDTGKNKIVYVHDYHIDSILKNLTKMVTCVFPLLNRKTQRSITFTLLNFIRDRLLKFDNVGINRRHNDEEVLITFEVKKPSAMEEIEYIEELLEKYS